MDTSFLEYDDLNYSFHFYKSKTTAKTLNILNWAKNINPE